MTVNYHFAIKKLFIEELLKLITSLLLLRLLSVIIYRTYRYNIFGVNTVYNSIQYYIVLIETI